MYTVDYFIEKFEAIPEANWTRFYVGRNGIHCALGHCGYTSGGFTEEASALCKLFDLNIGTFVTKINDRVTASYSQPTPKQRVLAALYDMKSKQAVEEVNKILAEENQQVFSMV